MSTSISTESEARRRAPWVHVFLGFGLFVGMLPLLIGAKHLPEPLATHWELSGFPNGNMSKGAFGLLLAVLVVPIWVFWIVPLRATVQTQVRTLLPLAAFAGTLTSGLGLLIGALNWDRSTWRQAEHVTWWHLALLLGIPALLAIGMSTWAVPRSPEGPRTVTETGNTTRALPIGAHERVYWSGAVSNRWLLLLPLLPTPLLLLSATVPRVWAFTVLVVTALATEQFSRVRVVITNRVLEVRFGNLGWIRQRLSLHEVKEANAFDLAPLDFGWGYRFASGRCTAIVVRGGEALRLELKSGRRFVITVDNAAAAATIVNDLLQCPRP